MDLTITVNINDLRITNANVRAWDLVFSGDQEIALLILDDLRTDANARGKVGRFKCVTDSRTQPQQGPNTQSRTFKPSSNSTATGDAWRYIYGSGIA